MKKQMSVEEELFLIEDHNLEEHNEGFTFQMYPKQMDYIRSGDVEGLKDTFTSAYTAYYRESLPDSSQLPFVLAHLCGCMLMLACEGGLPLGRSAAVSTKYVKMAPEVTDIDTFLITLKQMTGDFTEEVFLYKRFNTDSPVVNMCMRYIYEHVQEKIRVPDVAAFCGYSISRLQHLFHQYTGCTLTEYIRREKIEKACLLLKHTELPCVLISQKLSFGNQSHFIKQFRVEKGMTPAEYRRHYR